MKGFNVILHGFCSLMYVASSNCMSAIHEKGFKLCKGFMMCATDGFYRVYPQRNLRLRYELRSHGYDMDFGPLVFNFGHMIMF